MLAKALQGQLLVFRAGTSVIGIGIYADAAAGGEEAGHLYVFRIHEADEVLHDCVHAVLMEVAVIAETEKVKLEAF